jgi:hypothetical protein
MNGGTSLRAEAVISRFAASSMTATNPIASFAASPRYRRIPQAFPRIPKS